MASQFVSEQQGMHPSGTLLPDSEPSVQAVAILRSPSLQGFPLTCLCSVLLFLQTKERGISSKGGRREKSPGGRSPPAGSGAGPGEGRAAAAAGGGARAA